MAILVYYKPKTMNQKLLITRVSTESTSKRKFTEFVSNHIFSNKYWDMCLTIMHTEGVSNKIWSNCTRA